MTKKNTVRLEKRCSKCKQIKLLTEFYRNKTKVDGYRETCKVCSEEYKRTYRKANAEKNRKRKLEDVRENDKKCTKCKVIKLGHEFDLDATKASGLSAWCKECRAKYQDRD